MSHFYLTLPSNSSSNYYENTLASFTTRLHSSISLGGEWEVGLSEIIFPHSWLTLGRDDATFKLHCEQCVTGDQVIIPPYTTDVRIPFGYYDSIHDIIRDINKSLSKLLPMVTVSHGLSAKDKDDNFFPRLKYQEISKRVFFHMRRNQSFTFPPGLATILGVGEKQNPSKIKDEDAYSWGGNNVVDITKGINYLMVYCSLLEHVPVGDTKAPLLRIVDATGMNGEIIQRSFDEPRYMPIQKKNFDSIELNIRDDLGNLIAFENGKLVVTLHFRQTKSPYFLG